MRFASGLGAALAVSLLAGPAAASAWNQAQKGGQFIVKFEQMEATRAYEPDGRLAAFLRLATTAPCPACWNTA